MTATVLSTEISEVDNMISDHSKYSKLNLVNKTDFNNKITDFNRRITSNKTKHLEI